MREEAVIRLLREKRDERRKRKMWEEKLERWKEVFRVISLVLVVWAVAAFSLVVIR